MPKGIEINLIEFSELADRAGHQFRDDQVGLISEGATRLLR